MWILLVPLLGYHVRSYEEAESILMCKGLTMCEEESPILSRKPLRFGIGVREATVVNFLVRFRVIPLVRTLAASQCTILHLWYSPSSICASVS